MAPFDGPSGHSQKAQQRPIYVPASAVPDHHDRVLSTPSRLPRPSTGLHSISPKGVAPYLPSASTPRMNASPSASKAPRLSHDSPSAYERFNEVAWIVDLSSRIGDALVSPAHAPVLSPAAASSSSPHSTPHMLNRSQSRVRLPRPSREFRDLQQRLQQTRGLDSPLAAPDTSIGSIASDRVNDPDSSAIQWAQHAQQDFDRRRADLHRSRQDLLKHLEGDQMDQDADGQQTDSVANQTVDPAVQRSMLTARSLQELMNSGGLQPEDGDNDPNGFANLLDSAEPLPGPSSLFDANRASDGSLDIESILQQRARMAAIEDQDRADSSRPTSSMLDLSQAPSRPVKRPVIEMLNGETPDDAGKPSRSSDMDQSADSDSSQSPSDLQEGSSNRPAAFVETEHQARSGRQQANVPHPMDQIAIVDGAFKIIPAQSHQSPDPRQNISAPRDDAEAGSDDEEDEQAVDASEDEEMDSASDADDSEESDAATDEDDEDEEMDDSAERSHAAQPASRQYYGGYGGVDTRDLLTEGPAGDADEPIVLSDSDDDEDTGSSQRQDDSEEDDDEESEDDDRDELAQDSSDDSEQGSRGSAEADLVDIAALTQHDNQSQAQQARPEPEEPNQDPAGQEEDVQDDEAKQAFGAQPRSNAESIVADSLPVQQMQASDEPSAAPEAAHSLREILSSSTNGQLPVDSEGDGVPDSEVEPEELDEDLRWSDIEAAQLNEDDDYADAHGSDRLATADAAFRCIQGSQAMPGFVSAARILADIQAADAEAKMDSTDTTNVSRFDDEPIDPQLLADIAGSEAVVSANPTDATATANDGNVEVPGTSSSQTDADIFDAFTREDASSETREPFDDSRMEDADQVAAHVEMDQEDETAVREEASAAASPAATQPEDVIQEEVPIAGGEDVALLDKEADQHVEMSDGIGKEQEVSHDDPAEDKVTEARTEELVSETGGKAVSDAEAPETFESQEQEESPVQRAQEEVAAQAASMDADEETTTRSEKPVLVRIESTDVLEADVEDNGEEEAAPEDIVVHVSSASALPAAAAAVSSDSEADIAGPGSITPDAQGAEPPAIEPIDAALHAASSEVHDEHSSLQAVIPPPEEEGILSGDLADRDSSVERQAVPIEVEAPVATAKDEAQLHNDVLLADGPADSDVASPSYGATEVETSGDAPSADKQDEPVEEKESAAGHASPLDASVADDQDVKVLEEKNGVEHTSSDDNGVRKDVQKEEPRASNAAALSADLESKEGSNGTDTPTTVNPLSLTPIRVPPSPASSDRRSTSSFTPSANRQGNRHLHGTAKRSFFAQMTEAASGFASNLTAPLRAFPSLLPISEKRAEETQEANKGSETAAPAAMDSAGDSQTGRQQQAPHTNKRVETSKFTMNTRSHCICRRLQLTKVEGAPVFIVPGCSIDYERARAEDAEDLGPTDESLADQWLTVDPDFLPIDVHHKLSRVIGLQFLNEGICVEPGSSAAELVFAGLDLDADLLSSRDEDQKRSLGTEFDNQADEQAPTDTLKQKALAHKEEEKTADDNETKETYPADTADAGATDNDTARQEPETPSQATRRSKRHRRNSSIASTSSQHRSPHHPDPKSPNADYLPDDERRRLLKDRHPATPTRGDVSIASLEEHLKAKEDAEDDKPEDGNVAGDAGLEDVFSAPQESQSPRAKKKRGRARKNATADTSRLPQDKQGDDKGDDELLSEPKTKRRRGRTSSSPEQGTVDKAPVKVAKDAQDAETVEDALNSVAPPPKRGRGGRKSQGTTAANLEQQKANGDEDDGVEPAQSSSVRTRAAQKNEEAASQEADSEFRAGVASEPKQDPKGKRGGKGGRKRKQTIEEEPLTIAEASAPAGKVAKADEADSVKASPRRSRRSQGGAPAQSPSPSKTTPRKAPKRKNIIKLG